MAFKRIATLDIQTVFASDGKEKFAWRNFVKQANEEPTKIFKLPQLAYKFDTDHFLYLTARMISGMEKWGHNGNYDAFPWEEIKKAANTAIGKGFYIEHKEDSEADAKGAILDVFPNDEDQYLVALCCIDKEEYPEFVQQILDGTYNQVSMSCLANCCICSFCGNEAHSFDELCEHMNSNLPMLYLKGKKDDKGNDIYEINKDICFTGLSAVAVPADKDAFVFDIKAAKKKENKLQTELVKYQNIKQAGKMKEFKMACEEQFKNMDNFTLLNKLKNSTDNIINTISTQENDVNIITSPLQGILRQLMELQIGLNVMDLNKLTTPSIDNTVAIEGEPKTDVAEVTTNVEESKLGEGHILTNKDLKDQYNEEEVNFDKEIDSMLKQVKSEKELMTLKEFRNLMKEKGYKVKTKTWDFSGLGYGSHLGVEVYDGNVLINKDFATDEHYKKYSDVLNILNTHKIVKSLPENKEVNLDKEIDSYLDGDNYSYTPFSNTARKQMKKLQSGTYFLKNIKELQKFLDERGDEIRDFKVRKQGDGYRVYFENEYGRFHDDVFVEDNSLDEIIEKTY